MTCPAASYRALGRVSAEIPPEAAQPERPSLGQRSRQSSPLPPGLHFTQHQLWGPPQPGPWRPAQSCSPPKAAQQAWPVSAWFIHAQGCSQLGMHLVGPQGFQPAQLTRPLPWLCSSCRLKSCLYPWLYPTPGAPVVPSPPARQTPALLLHETSGRLSRAEEQQQETSECWYRHWPQLPLAANTLIRPSRGPSGILVSNGHNYIS